MLNSELQFNHPAHFPVTVSANPQTENNLILND